MFLYPHHTELHEILSKYSHFSQDDILKTIRNLNSHKAHGPDKISIRMIKICGNSLCKPSEMIFKSCIIKGELSSEWKKANVVPVHKKKRQAIAKELQTDLIATNLRKTF